MEHLYVLHLFGNTGIPKVDEVAKERYRNLMEELDKQGITEYTLIQGTYEPGNTKKAIHAGHRRIVQHAKDIGLKRVVIAEDDICFTHPNSFKYFLSQIPDSYDTFSALYYSASVEGNRILNGGSGIVSLYVINSRFYDKYLSMNTDTHVDRELALTAFENEYLVCRPFVAFQRGGFSQNLKRSMTYEVYLEGKKMYNGC